MFVKNNLTGLSHSGLETDWQTLGILQLLGENV